MDQKAAREYLLPGIWKREEAKGRELDLVCNDAGGIDLQVGQRCHQVLTSAEIKTNQWGPFNPRIVKILEENG